MTKPGVPASIGERPRQANVVSLGAIVQVLREIMQRQWHRHLTGKPVYVPSAPEQREPVKARVATESSPHAKRMEQLTKELEDKAELGKYVEKPQTRVVITGVDIPFWDMVVLIFKWSLATIPTLIFFFVIYVVLALILMRIGIHYALRGMPH